MNSAKQAVATLNNMSANRDQDQLIFSILNLNMNVCCQSL